MPQPKPWRWRAYGWPGQCGTVWPGDRTLHKYWIRPQKRLELCKSRPYARGHHTTRTCTLFPLALLVAGETPALASPTSGISHQPSPPMLLLLLGSELLLIALVSTPALLLLSPNSIVSLLLRLLPGAPIPLLSLRLLHGAPILLLLLRLLPGTTKPLLRLLLLSGVINPLLGLLLSGAAQPPAPNVRSGEQPRCRTCGYLMRTIH